MTKAVGWDRGNQNFLFRDYLGPSSVDVSPPPPSLLHMYLQTIMFFNVSQFWLPLES